MHRRDDATDIQGVLPAERPGLRVIAMWSGGHCAREVPRSGTMVIGRSADADLVVDHPSVSRKHATLHFEPGERIRIEDDGSANGTFVDGVKLDSGGTAAIAPGNVVELGAAMIVLRGTPATSRVAATPDPPSVPTGKMAEAHELADVVAQSKLTVLIIGETGAGKEVLAARIHAASPRHDKPFLKLNCAALVENLLESELFGHERGAFTGATTTKVGLAEAANAGTLFLDEIGELSPGLQAKLLRLLESGEITRVGALKPIAVDVRFVCATNRDLRAMVDEGSFRSDLYFRLDGLTIHVPPLRDRRDEIVSLARLFVEEAAAEAGRSAPVLAPDAEARLLAHDWPGNVRELRNVMMRSVLLSKTATLGAAELRIESEGVAATHERSASGASASEPASASTSASDDKRRRVMDALEKSFWNQTRAAELLGVTRRTLHNWLEELGIPRARGRRR